MLDRLSHPDAPFIFIFNFILIPEQLAYSIILVSGVQYSDSTIPYTPLSAYYIYFFIFKMIQIL